MHWCFSSQCLFSIQWEWDGSLIHLKNVVLAMVLSWKMIVMIPDKTVWLMGSFVGMLFKLLCSHVVTNCTVLSTIILKGMCPFWLLMKCLAPFVRSSNNSILHHHSSTSTVISHVTYQPQLSLHTELNNLNYKFILYSPSSSVSFIYWQWTSTVTYFAKYIVQLWHPTDLLIWLDLQCLTLFPVQEISID